MPPGARCISYTCLGCHGIAGYKNAYPNYSVPKLLGQSPEYLRQPARISGRDRSLLTMHSEARTLSDQDMADIAAYFAGKPLEASGKAPRTFPRRRGCAPCHGADGVSVTPMYPPLAGQHEDYLMRALEEYKRGGRKNPIMKGFAANLSDEDIESIAQYFSHLTPSLGTEPRPYTRLTAD